MAAVVGRSLLTTLILCNIASYYRGTCLSGVSKNVHRYAEQHYKRNWLKRVEEIRFPSSRKGAAFVYLPHEVILMKQALSKEEQIRLFSQFVPFITARERQADQSLCAEDKCILFTSQMTEEKDKNLQEIGSTLFLETAEQLANIQQVTPGYIDDNLKLKAEKAPRFPAVHGVWYNENGYLRSHRDRTWDRANKTAQTEWVLSISLGATARFTYHHPKDKEEHHSISVSVASGDVLLFNGAYLYHSVQVLEESVPEWWKKELGSLQGRLNLQYRVLTGKGEASKNDKNIFFSTGKIPVKDNKIETSQPTETCSDVEERCQPHGIFADNSWLMRVEDKPSANADNSWLMRVEDKPSANADNSWLTRVEDKPSANADNSWLMRVEDKPSANADNSWLMRVEDKPSANADNSWLMRVEDKPSANADNSWLMRVEDKPSANADNSWLMRVEDKPSANADNSWLMRVEDKPSANADNSWLMRVEDKPSANADNSLLMRVEDKPSANADNSWLMRVEDKPSANADNSWLMRVEDKPSANADNSWLMRVEDKPSANADNSWLMRVEDKPSANADNSWLMRVEDKPSANADNSWLMRVEDKPSANADNSWLMRVEDKPSANADNSWLMRVEDKPSANADNSWLMRVEDKPSANADNSWLMRVEDKPSANADNSWLMRVEDKPSANADNSWLMRVEDKPSANADNSWLMRVEDKPSANADNSWLMRVEDKPSANADNSWLMRVEDKPSANADNSWLMRVEDKPSADADNRWLMRVEDKPSANADNRWLMRVEDKPVFSETRAVKKTKVKDKVGQKCFLNHSEIGYASSGVKVSHHSPALPRKKMPENLSWLPLVKDSDRELTAANLTFPSTSKAAPYLGFTNSLFQQFWCFNSTINKEHQIRTIVALGGNANTNYVKKHFYEKLKLIQGLNIPVHENRIVLSFEGRDVVESMYKSGLLVNPKTFILNGNHIFSRREQKKITEKTAEAMKFIRQADSVLYKSMLQVVACIGYYKAAEKGHLGGTVSSAVGLIWLDPSKGGDWSIPFLAEQIVHEYIHTTLFIAEMVRGMYTDVSLVPKSMVVSAIRRQKRGYDKSFHAAYVAAGLVAFHAETGSIRRANELAQYLNQSVHDLEKVQTETSVLDETGFGMLLHLKTFLSRAKLM